MSAVRLGGNGIDTPLYAVVGACTSTHYVAHVGVLAQAGSLVDAQTVPVFHMANAIHGLELPGTMTANAAGWLDTISASDAGAVVDWLNGLATAGFRIEYFAYPSCETERDAVTKRAITRRFSCAGFVHGCYDEALGIKLVATEDTLPAVDLELLSQVWGPVIMLRGQRYLRGPGPWPVLLPSYILHALAVGAGGLPHLPARADPHFAPIADVVSVSNAADSANE